MPAGTDTYKGLAVPLYGHSNMEGVTAATDILTIDGPASMSGDYIVFRDSANAELSYFSSLGSLTYPGAIGASGVILGKGTVGQTAFARLRLPILSTAPASAGLTKGDIWLALATADVYRFALCISTAAGTARYGHRFTRATLGSASH